MQRLQKYSAFLPHAESISDEQYQCNSLAITGLQDDGKCKHFLASLLTMIAALLA